MTFSYVRGLVVLSMAVLQLPANAVASVLYATGFEPPTFVPGLLPPQDGWFAGASPRAARQDTPGRRSHIFVLRPVSTRHLLSDTPLAAWSDHE